MNSCWEQKGCELGLGFPYWAAGVLGRRLRKGQAGCCIFCLWLAEEMVLYVWELTIS